MYYIIFVHVLVSIPLIAVQVTMEQEYLNYEEDKIDLRRELDRLTQELLVDRDPFYHSYVFNSGVGNREKLTVEWMREESWFPAEEAVISWQAVRNIGQIHLLGQKLSSVTLVTTAHQLSANRSAQFHRHSISYEANVTCSSLFIRWNPVTAMPEVVAVVALDTAVADVLFYSVVNGKLEYIMQWSRYKKIRILNAVNVDGKNQLIVVDKGSPAVVDVFEVLFVPDSAKLDFRLVQSFSVSGGCGSVTVCRVGRQHYLVLRLDDRLAVRRLTYGHYQQHTELSLPRVSQVICFTVALQTYLAVNGETAHVLRLTEAGEIVSELMSGPVDEWLVLPVSSYRSDVLLLSRAANLTKAYVWAGANKGFEAVAIPQCSGDSCLEGDWSGAVSVPFQHQNCLLIPRPLNSSSLVMVGTTLRSNNPVLDKLMDTIDSMKKCQDEWSQIKSRMAELLEVLQHVVKKDGANDITATWTVEWLEVPRVRLSSIVQPANESSQREETGHEDGEGPMEIEGLESAVEAVMAEGIKVIQAVEEREKEAWGLDGFRGKVSFKNMLKVDNLTISQLNGEPMDLLLHNTFRKDRPETIQNWVTATSLKTENIMVSRINNFTKDDLKFADGPVEMRGDVTFERPLTVKGGVELRDGGRLNGVDLSEDLCRGREGCTVFPMINLNEDDVRAGELNNNIDKSSAVSPSNTVWSKAIAGRNLTVVKVNGVDWKTLAENVVYKNIPQNITGTVVVKGKVTSVPALWADSYQYLDQSQPRSSDSQDQSPEESSPVLEASPSERRPVSQTRMDLDELPSASEVIVSELEVTGTVSCGESEWGAEAADVVLSDTNPITIQGAKTFNGPVNVTNNAQVEGTIGGVDTADLFTIDSDQTFSGPTTLLGAVTVENLVISGLLNGMNLSDVVSDEDKVMSGDVITAESVNVLETINEVPVSEAVLTGHDGVTSVKTVNASELYVTEDIVSEGKVCGLYLDDFNEKRLSLQKDQNISGNVSIKTAIITDTFQVKMLNGVEISSLVGVSLDSDPQQTIHLSELHVEGDIETRFGVNGFNLTDVADSAVWLEKNNDVNALLDFKDEVSFELLDAKSMCNDITCDQWLDFSDVVFKNNKSVTFTGSKEFMETLTITEDLEIQELNGHKIQEVLTKTTEQDIIGDITVDGDVRVENLTVNGLLNGQNITEFGQRCSVSDDTISCKGSVQFNGNVVVNHFNTSGKMNEVEFDSFIKSVVRTNRPIEIQGIKRFSGNTVEVENIEGVETINGESWDDFLLDSVRADDVDQVDHPVTFRDILTLGELSVDFHMNADTVDTVNISEWKTEAVYINGSLEVAREIRLESAVSKGDLQIDDYNGLNMDGDIVRLHSPSHLSSLWAKSIEVSDNFDGPEEVNRQYLAQVEQNTLKTSGNQVVLSDLIVGELVVEGSLDTEALVNEEQLKNVVTSDTDQTLHGKYEFDCVKAEGNVDTSEIVSGINLTTWKETGVVKDGRKQVISGEWRVGDTLEVKGAVAGRGRLGDVDLRHLTDYITRDILDVHSQMKSNLSEACEEANVHLASARASPTKLHYLDVTQTLPVPSGPSLVTHFQSDGDDFLAVSENSCVTTLYKWNKDTGKFTSVHREKFGFALRTFIILNHEQLTYVLTESTVNSSDCEYIGKHLWIFMKDHFKYVSAVNFFEGDLFQGEGNTLYVINSAGMFKYALHFNVFEGKAFFQSALHHWNISTDAPREWFGAAQYEWLSDVHNMSNCSGEVISVSVDPSRQFVAIAASEPAEVPRHADYVKVYRRNGRLFDKMPAQRVNQLQWLTVPAQTWLVALQNHSSLNLFQLQGPLVGFQLQISAPVEATRVTTLVLPLTDRVNPQPYLVLQSATAVSVMRAFVQGDPYLGDVLNCNFDQVLKRVPIK